MTNLSPEQRSGIFLENISTSDCGVIAIQAVTGLERNAALVLAKRHGYEEGHGIPSMGTSAAIREAGYTVEAVTFELGDTPAIFSLEHEDGKFLLYTPGHVMGLVDGDLHNARHEWSVPLFAADKVTS